MLRSANATSRKSSRSLVDKSCCQSCVVTVLIGFFLSGLALEGSLNSHAPKPCSPELKVISMVFSYSADCGKNLIAATTTEIGEGCMVEDAGRSIPDVEKNTEQRAVLRITLHALAK